MFRFFLVHELLLLYKSEAKAKKQTKQQLKLKMKDQTKYYTQYVLLLFLCAIEMFKSSYLFVLCFVYLFGFFFKITKSLFGFYTKTRAQRPKRATLFDDRVNKVFLNMMMVFGFVSHHVPVCFIEIGKTIVFVFFLNCLNSRQNFQ